MKSRFRSHGLLVTLVLLAFTATAHAAETTIPVTNTVWIENTRGDSRVVMALGPLDELSSDWVSAARLRLTLTGIISIDQIPMYIHGISTPWSGTPTWTSPWQTPGGDVSETDVVAAEAVTPGQSTVTVDLDVTELIRSMVEGDLAPNGLLLSTGDTGRVGFKAAERTVLGDLTGAELIVNYRSLRGMGYQTSAKALLDRRRASRAAPDRPR
ncbi:MAG: DNRLRE domain-containing protein [bacterium]